MTDLEDHAPAVDNNGGRGGEIEDHTDSKSQTLNEEEKEMSITNHEKKFAFVEMPSVEAMSSGLEGPDRLSVGGLPCDSTELKVRALLESFGELKRFDLVKDRETGNSKGYAFCAYEDDSITDIACACLTGIKMGDKTLIVRRASHGTMQPRRKLESILFHAQQQIAIQVNLLQPGPVATTVVCLTHVVNENELRDDEEFKDIMENMKQEGRKFGALTNVVIPRLSPSGEPVPGLGKVFLKYDDTDGSSRARRGLNGRKFGGKEVVAVFYPEDKFDQGDYSA